LQRALSSHLTHLLPCRDGDTPLTLAIKKGAGLFSIFGGESAVVSYLRSIGAPE
jgi:hypothetical protein